MVTRAAWMIPLALLLAVITTATAEQKPAGLELFDAALAKFEADRIALRRWQYHQTLTTQQFDSGGKVVAKGTWKSIVRPGDPRPLEYTFESMDGQLSFFKAGAEEPQSGASATPPPKGKPRHDESEKNQAEAAIEAVRKYNLRDRYVWKNAGSEMVSGESAYVLTFEPKPKQNTRTREERFFGQLAGRLWVARSDNTVLKAEASLQSPAHLFWVIARVTVFRLTYKLEPDTGSGRLFRHAKATARTEVAFPFYKVRQKHSLTMEQFEPRKPRGTHTPVRARTP